MRLREGYIFGKRRAIEAPGPGQEIDKVSLCAIVVGREFESTRQLIVSTLGIPQLQISLRQLRMPLGKTGINLHRVGKLNDRFAVLALAKILFPTFEILLLARVGIT